MPLVCEQKTVSVKHSIKLTDADIRALLIAQGYQVPEGARVFVHVPGGGDWSHTDLSVDNKDPIHVEWQTSHDE